MSPVSRRSPNQFVQFDRFGRRFEREDLNLERLPQHDDSIEFQLRRDRVDDEDRRILGVSDRLEGNWDHHNRDVDHRERFYPEMVMREQFEPNSSNSEYDRNDEGLFRGGRRDSGDVGFVDNVNKRYGGGGGGREVSRSPIKFRIGGVEGDDRFANRGRKDVQELKNRGTPRKNVQKKSAFLRIQPGKPQHYTSNFRNRFDSSTNSSPHKGKESNLESVHNRISEERVGSPVELDVSFKSNALVAKAIMVAPSCSGVEVNVNNALSDSGTRIDSESPAKVATPKLKSVVSVKEDKDPKNRVVSLRDDKDPKNRVRMSPNSIKKRVGVSNTAEARGSESSPGVCSTLSGGALRKVPAKGKVLVKVNKNAGSDKVSPPVVRKKRKTTSQLSRLSSSPMPSSVNFVDNVHFPNDNLDLKYTQTNKQILLIMSTELPDGVVTGGQSAPIEMPKTPPLPCNGKTPDNDAVNSGELTFSLPVDHSEGKDNEEAMKAYDSPLSSWRDPESSAKRTLEDSGICSDGELQGSNSKRMVYINRKSNQSIAASKSSQLSVHNMGKTAASSSNKNYYKRRKYQLIRASSDGNIQQMVAVIKDNSKSDSQSALHPYSSASSTKRPSNKVKASKFSLVWKLGDSMSSGKGADALRSGRLLSHLLPWKRSTYWSRKLLSSRKRGAVYVRSGRGFSLRRSKVTSLPGTSLKWSKSMEKCSKKVEEEAAKAVAAVQQPGSSGISSKAASSLHSLHKVGHGLKLHPGERIFRIGVFRYRMDPSRRTLQRISDEEASDFTAPKTEKDARKTYVPKRLLIGSDEYVRIGNGNQLVRDPKRRTRILASEKVRWSLHTARMRLAKKRKFCQFFTRFGKCNKGEGKCPFIHDPSKLAVCTKFLNGLCSDTNCKLTHKVIPERMPDCSFYLQGLCSNEKCPYRHVNVNPKASICESFLRGYCAEGNECRKKHSYVCPEFEASGSCPQGSKCKLYHPRKVKAKKRKVSSDQNKAKGRYFGSDDDLSVVADPELRPMVEMPVEPSKDGFSIQEDLGDFISLDVGDNEALESGLTSEQTKDGPLDSQLDGIDEMIVPLSILGAL